MLRGVPSSPVTSYDWIEYFYQNANEPALPWEDGHRLSRAERMLVAESIRRFRRGDTPDADFLIEQAQRFARESGDRGFFYAFRLLMREEARQSRMLARFLRLEGAGSLRKSGTDMVLHCVRSVAGLEAWMIVLATAEVIAKSYYAALRDATGSTLLRELCETMLKEEAAHLRFRTFALRKFQAKRRPAGRSILLTAHRTFLLLAGALVWLRHHAIFRAAGRKPQELADECLREFNRLYT